MNLFNIIYVTFAGMSPVISQVFLIIMAFLVVQILCNVGVIIYIRCIAKSKTKIAPIPSPAI